MQTYPIQTGSSAPVTTFLLASQLGLALNCDLLTGLDRNTGAPAADDAPAINAAMASASAQNPICLVMDGGACVSALKFPAGGHWSIQGFGRDTGFFSKTGTNDNVLQNGTLRPNQPMGHAAPARGANVSIRDIFINGNSGDGTNGNSTSGDRRGTSSVWFYAIYMNNLDHVVIRDVHIIGSPSFQLVFENCGDWIVDGCNFYGTTDNTDGIHVNGPSNDGRISNCIFTCGDDPIALNAPEGYGGLITRIAIDNCVSSNSRTLGRIYTNSVPGAGGGATPRVDGVTWSNYQATAYLDGLFIGLAFTPQPGSVSDSITNVSFLNCRFTAPKAVEFNDSIGTITFNSCDWTTQFGTLFYGSDGTFQIDSLNIVNCRALRPGAGLTAILGADDRTTYKRVNINGFAVVDVAGYSGSPISGLLSLTSGAMLSQLQIDAVDASNIAALIASGTSAPASVSGAAVLQTGWPIADTAMAKWTPYVSSTSGAPSYKNAAGAVVAL